MGSTPISLIQRKQMLNFFKNLFLFKKEVYLPEKVYSTIAEGVQESLNKDLRLFPYTYPTRITKITRFNEIIFIIEYIDAEKIKFLSCKEVGRPTGIFFASKKSQRILKARLSGKGTHFSGPMKNIDAIEPVNYFVVLMCLVLILTGSLKKET